MTDQHRSPWARPADAERGDQPGPLPPPRTVPPSAADDRPASDDWSGSGDRPGSDSRSAVNERPGGEGRSARLDESSARVAAEVRVWRARAAATADPAWSREGAAETDGPDWGRASTTPIIAAPWELPSSPGSAPGEPPTGGTVTAASGRRRGMLAGPVAMGAGLGVIVASGMRWATVRAYGFIEFSLRGTDPGQHGRLTVVLGILAVLAGLLLTGRHPEWGRLLAAVAGLMVAVTAIVDLTRLDGSGPFEDSGLDASVTIGPGVWLVLVCGLLVFAAGIIRPRPRARRTSPIRGTPG
ncbi:hypothetical protein [Frankia sp. R82]|uniref:hypothetical protein n=1 Tax=Frankia sp. R82 TaxID=2950553 RepID=UPI002044A432|nr:hypothetical protein [Frankia sp. R82]MCM3884702.1 hypothetical protein [Frankia sp. R82]